MPDSHASLSEAFQPGVVRRLTQSDPNSVSDLVHLGGGTHAGAVGAIGQDAASHVRVRREFGQALLDWGE